MRGDRSGRPQRRSSQLVAWSPLAVALVAVWVQLTHTGVDVLLLGLAALVAVALERTLGDWLGETIGAVPAGIGFSLLVCAGAWFFLKSDAGSDATAAFFDAAEQRGYHTALFTPPIPESRVAPVPSPDSPPARTPEGESASERKPKPAGGAHSDAARPKTAAPANESTEAASAPASDKPADPQDTPPVRWTFLTRPAPPVPIPSALTLRAFPAEVELAHSAEIRASVTARGVPATDGFVQFSLDGQGLGRVPIDGQGIAVKTVSSSIAGQHELQAHYTGTEKLGGATATLVLRVLEPKTP